MPEFRMCRVGVCLVLASVVCSSAYAAESLLKNPSFERPKEAENWYRDHPGPADYADLVIVAQLHEGVGGDIDPSKVPALARLGLSPEEIDRGLELLHDAQEEIATAGRLLAG